MSIVETERLLLRPVGANDAADLVELHREPGIARRIGLSRVNVTRRGWRRT